MLGAQREVEEMASLRDSPRPDVYWPNTPSQWREPSVDDCTWYATEFAFQAASENHLNMHPVKDLRNKSTDTEGGTPVDVALRDTFKLWPIRENVGYRYGAFNFATIRRSLRDGSTIVVGGDYEKLPLHYRRWTNNDTFNHAMAARDLRKNKAGEWLTFLYDPLGGGPAREPYDGEWIKLDDLLTFTWNASSRTWWLGIVYNRSEIPMKYLNLPAQYKPDRFARLKRGAPVRSEPRATSEVVRKFWNENTRRPILYAVDGGWVCVLWKDDKEWQWGYADPDDVIAKGGWPVPPIDDGVDDCSDVDARVEALTNALVEVRDVADAALNPEPEQQG